MVVVACAFLQTERETPEQLSLTALDEEVRKPGGTHQVWHLSKQDSVLSLKQDVCITALPSKAQEALQRRAQQGRRTGVGDC